MKVVFKADRKTIEFVDGITKVNANDVNWQLFEIVLETPLALRESLWITYQNAADELEHTHPFLVSATQSGVYYAKIPPEIIMKAGVWNFQLFVRQYTTTGNGKYVQYPSNVYSFTVENGLPVDGEGMPVSNETIAAMYNTARDIIRRFYGTEKAVTINFELHSSETVTARGLTGCALIDWGDGSMEDGDAKTGTEYTHTYAQPGKYIAKFYGVTNIGANAFADFSGIYDLELHNSLLSIGEFAFIHSSINKLTIPSSVEYLSNCFLTTDSVRIIEIEQAYPEQFNRNAFKHFLAGLPMECTVIVPYSSLEAYELEFVTMPEVERFTTRATTASDGFVYRIVDGVEAFVTDIGSVTDTVITIPSSVTIGEETYPVTGIDHNAFENNKNITLVKMPSSINFIGDAAFAGCTALASVTISANVKTLRYRVFDGCTALQGITFNGTITKIDNLAFYNCVQLSQNSFNKVFSGVETLGVACFSGCKYVKTISIPSKVTVIPAGAFQKSGASKVTLRANITKVEGEAFADCSSLTEVIVYATTPPTTSSNVFSNCTSLQYIFVPKASIPAYWEASGWKTYSDKIRATGTSGILTAVSKPTITIAVDGKVTFTSANATGYRYIINGGEEIEIGKSGYTIYLEKGDNIKAMGIGDRISYTDSEYSAVKTYTPSATSTGSLDYVLMSNGNYKIVGASAYQGTSLSTNMTYRGKSVTAIGAEAFKGQSTITTLEITGNITDIGADAFVESAVTTVTFNASVDTIGGFKDCFFLKKITIGARITEIEEDAFYACPSLKTVTWHNNITVIGNNAFSNCYALTELAMPTALTEIGANAFKDTDLSKITLHSNIEYIGEDAFLIATEKIITINKTTPFVIGTRVFGYTESVLRITVPAGVKNEYIAYSDAWAEYADKIYGANEEGQLGYALDATESYYIVVNRGSVISSSIVIPDTYNGLPVKAIGQEAFSFDPDLQNVTIGGNIESIGKYAFSSTFLQHITFNDKLKIIEYGAFMASDIAEVTLPDSLSHILDRAFMYCANLTTVSLPEGLLIIGGEAFASTKIGRIEIPSTVNAINSEAFNNTLLTVVEMRAETPLFDATAEFNPFGNNLEKIIVPSGRADAYKTAWPDFASLIVAEEKQFDYVLSDDGTYYIIVGIGEVTDTSIVIPSKYNNLPVKEINLNAFRENATITSVYIPSSVEKIGGAAFYACPNLKTITFAEGLKTIENGAFYDVNVETLMLPKSLETIGGWAFWGAFIRTLVIPENVKSIGSSAFASCVALAEVTVKATTPPVLEGDIFTNTRVSKINVPSGSVDAYRIAWSMYADLLPAGSSGGSGGSGDGEGDGGDVPDVPDIPDIPTEPDVPVYPKEKLETPYVDISDYGVAHFISANATAYAYKIDGGAEVRTTATSVQLLDGQTFKVKAVGDGKMYTDSDYTQLYTYVDNFSVTPDAPYLPELEDIEITINPFERYALYKELDYRLADLEANAGDNLDVLNNLQEEKQDKVDERLNTTSKEVYAAINEVHGVVDQYDDRVKRLEAEDIAVSHTIDGLRSEDLLIKESVTAMNNKHDRDMATLAESTAKNAESIKEVEAIAKGAAVPIDFDNYEAMISALNAADKTKYLKGNNIHVVTLNVPDVWISAIYDTNIPYRYTTDEDFETKLKSATGRVQVGYYVLSALEGQKVDLTNYPTKNEFKTIVEALVDLFPTVKR